MEETAHLDENAARLLAGASGDPTVVQARMKEGERAACLLAAATACMWVLAGSIVDQAPRPDVRAQLSRCLAPSHPAPPTSLRWAPTT